MGLSTLAAALAAGGAAYSLYEPYRYRVRVLRVPVGSSRPFELGSEVSILHLSDLHASGRDRRLSHFIASLPERLEIVPDLAVITGDLIEDDDGIDLVTRSVARIPAALGRFYVLGSHDYYHPRFTSYLRYFSGGRPTGTPRASTERLISVLQEHGWAALTNTERVVESAGRQVRVVGLDDPHIGRHDPAVIRRAEADALALGLVHTPDVVSEWALAGFDLVLAGHTHGGQVRLPRAGAVVTNCTLPTPLAAGLHRVGATWLHVSPGLGTGKYSPVRFNCRPEATLLRLVPS